MATGQTANAQGVKINISSFTATFSGENGQNPEDYIEDIETHMEGAATQNLDRLRRVLFQRGLRGIAAGWYDKLSENNRHWEPMINLFREKYRRRDTGRDWNLGAQSTLR